MSLELDIVRDSQLWDALPDAEAVVTRAAQAAVQAADVEAQSVLKQLAVVLTDDASVRSLNNEWRRKDAPTNVLSFPAPAHPGNGPWFLGDVILAFETIEREALADGKSLEAHLAHLVIHGVLHLHGYDHEAEDEASRMEALETHILASLGIADPYAAETR